MDTVRRAEFAFYPDAAGQPRRLEDLSDGQKSLFHIALTAATLEIERDALAVDAADSAFDQTKLRRTYLTLLAIEEPENSLSPFFLSRIIGQARDIGRMDEAQVVISSHSASILSRIEPEEVRYTRLNATTRTSAIRRLEAANHPISVDHAILTPPQSGRPNRSVDRLLCQISVRSANSKASSRSTPRYRTVFSILVWPSRIWIARILPVAR